MIRQKLALFGLLIFIGCNKTQDGTVRSPALDYQPPPPESAADGEPVGADRVAPSDKLEQGVSTSGPAPGWHEGKTGPTYDPKQQVGGSVDPPSEGGSQK
jgi:hypothetical protein